MKNYVNIILILSLLVFAFGCNQETPISKESPFIGGTTGLLISYDEGAPPAEVYDGGDFDFEIVVKLKNDGEQSVSKDKVEVSLSGIDPKEFGLSDSDFVKHPDEDLEGTYKDSEGNKIEGTTTYVVFSGLNHRESLTGNTPYTIRADVCYNYATNVNSMLCIKKGQTDKERDICKINEEKAVFNSGGPVQVTSFKEMPKGKNKFNFQFKIEPKGNGGIYKKDSNCEYTRANENKVFVSVDTGMDGLSCTGLDGTTSGYVTLYGGERMITCTQETETNTDFEKPVNIKLEYDY
ncbi:MAG TPA: hypothetical protein ENL45_00725, partial [Candidatus Woesearchaeota archaeon]|nr:hypothetical protein [Candidatus Woesearchaeota archaeon]